MEDHVSVKPHEADSTSLTKRDAVDLAQVISEKEQNVENNERYLRGWRLHLTTISLNMSIFLASLEVSIVATALVSISNDLGDFDRSSWIVNAYMLTYTGFLIIWAKMSDIFGRKLFIITSVTLFLLFSAGCGAAQTTLQLIILRAFQGLAGAGTYSITMVMLFELVPPNKFAAYTSLVSITLAIALLLGPLLGGAITTYTTWRWIFLINVPAGVITVAMLTIAIPNGFPNHNSKKQDSTTKLLSSKTFGCIDFLGVALLLAASIILVTGFEEAGLGHALDSSLVLCLLVIGILMWVVFVGWERYVTLARTRPEPIFPWRFFQSRVRIGLILNTIFVGGPFTVCVIQIPQRFQSVNGLGPLAAGVRLLPFALMSPFGTALAAGIAGKARVPPIYLIFVGSCLQIIAFGLLTTLPDYEQIWTGQYGYQVIAGIGVGIQFGCLWPMAPFTVEASDRSVTMSALVQFRTIGGSLCLAIAASLLNQYASKHLTAVVGLEQTQVLLKSLQEIRALDAQTRAQVVGIFASGYRLSFYVCIGFSAAQIPATLMMWQKKQVRF